MFFRNLQPYRLLVGWDITADRLAEQLGRKTFQPCGNQDAETRGWVSPTGDGFLVHQVGAHWLICLQTESKILPAAVVKEEAERRAEQQGFKPGRKQMKELRELVLQELLPRAFRRTRKTFAWIDPAAGWLCVDAPSQSRAEDLLEALRQSLDALPLALVRTNLSPTSAMADWLASDEAPDGFTLEQDFALQSVSEDKAKAVFTHHDTEAAHVREHLAAGKLPTKLALTYDDRISFVLTEKLEIKRLDFLDIVRDQLDQQDADDARALFDAGFALMTGELSRLLPALTAALGGELQREPDLVDAAEAPAPYLPFDGEPTNDPLYVDAKRIVIAFDRPSISLVQRELRIGYNRAARLIEQMERDGIVTPQKPDGSRAVIRAAA